MHIGTTYNHLTTNIIHYPDTWMHWGHSSSIHPHSPPINTSHLTDHWGNNIDIPVALHGSPVQPKHQQGKCLWSSPCIPHQSTLIPSTNTAPVSLLFLPLPSLITHKSSVVCTQWQWPVTKQLQNTQPMKCNALLISSRDKWLHCHSDSCVLYLHMWTSWHLSKIWGRDKGPQRHASTCQKGPKKS